MAVCARRGTSYDSSSSSKKENYYRAGVLRRSPDMRRRAGNAESSPGKSDNGDAKARRGAALSRSWTLRSPVCGTSARARGTSAAVVPPASEPSSSSPGTRAAHPTWLRSSPALAAAAVIQPFKAIECNASGPAGTYLGTDGGSRKIVSRAASASPKHDAANHPDAGGAASKDARCV